MNDINTTVATSFFASATWSLLDGVLTIITVGGVFYSIWQGRKQLKEIKIILEFDDGHQVSIFPVKRKNFSRAELKGILREHHNSRDNYELSYMKEDDFLKNIFSIQDGKEDTFIMKIRDSDFFEFKR